MDNSDDVHPAFRSTLKVETRVISAADHKKLVSKAKERARDPSIFDEEGHEPFFWTARASNQTIDAYFTKMNESSLQNYVNDADDPGVQFQNSHNVREVGFGRSLGGIVTGRSGAKEALIDFYAIRGLSSGSMTSDQFVDGVRAGIYNDVSIGFTPGKMICNICGNDWLKRFNWLFDMDSSREKDTCTHWPGKEYETEKGKKPVVCVLDVQEARLNEVSLVYDGATPGAGIAAVDMARMASASGKLPETERMFLEGLYRYRIAPPAVVYGGVTLDQEKIRAMETPIENNDVAVADPQPTVRKTVLRSGKPEVAAADNSLEPMERLRAKFGEQLGEFGDDPYEVIETLAERVIAQDQEVAKLTTEAGYGREAREALIGELDATVVRAFGADENTAARQERYRRMVKEMSMVDVRATIDDLEQKAVSRIGRGGQHIKLEESEEVEGSTIADRKTEKRGRTPARLV